MTNSTGSDMRGEMSASLKRFMASDPASVKYVDKAEIYLLISIIERIGSSGDAFLAALNPYDDDYEISVLSFGETVRLICGMMLRPADIRIFGDSWAVGISSYNSSSQAENDEFLSLDELEIKISLVGSASTWLAIEKRQID